MITIIKEVIGLLVFTYFFKLVDTTESKCYALALGSGFESTAYQAGVLKGIFSLLDEEDSDYYSISAVSGGALNAAILASFPKGEELEAAERMREFWLAAGRAKLYRNWVGYIVQGLFWKGGLYDSSAMKEFLKE